MDNNKGQTVFLSVIGIATLLVAIIGATFAYFSLTVTGNENASSIYVQTAVLGNVVFTDTSEISMTDVNPNDNPGNIFTTDTANVDGKNYITKTFTIENTSTDGKLTSAVNYYIYLVGVGSGQSLIDATVKSGSGSSATYETVAGNATHNANDPWFAYKLSCEIDEDNEEIDECAATGNASTNWTQVKVSDEAYIGSGVFKVDTSNNKHTWKFEMAFINDDKNSQDKAQGKSFTGKIQVSLTNNGINTSSNPGNPGA